MPDSGFVGTSLVGRQAPLDALLAVARRAVAGRGGLALVRGEAGIGKTRLVEELADHAPVVGLDVAWATCWEGGGAPAFWPWIQVLRDLGLDDTADALAGEVGLELGAERFARFDHVGRALAAAARDRALLVVLDDLHWADSGTALLLRALLDKLGAAPLLIVATYRAEEVTGSHPLAGEVAVLARAATLVDLRGLDADGVAVLARSLGSEADPAELYRRSHGNPLFVLELLRLLQTEGSLEGVPAGVAAVIGRRFDHLSTAVQDVLAAAAVVGSEGGVGPLAAMTGVPPADLLDALAIGADAGLLLPVESGRWAFRHPLIRDVIWRGLLPRQRATLHLAAADAIEGSGAGPEHPAELARLLAEAAPLDESIRGRAALWAREAGDRAASVLAFEEAIAQYRRGLSLISPADVDSRIGLLLGLGHAELGAGDGAAAQMSFDAVVALAREQDRPDDLARAALGPGGFEIRMFDFHQLGVLEEALEVLGPQPSPLRARVLARLAVAQGFLKTPEERRRLSSEAVAIARRLGDPAVLGAALAAHHDVIAGPNFVSERLALASELLELARTMGDRELEALALRFRVVAVLERGDVAAFRDTIAAYAAVAEMIGLPLFQWYVPLWRATLALLQNDVVSADREAARAEELGQRAGSRNARMLVDSQRWDRFAAARDRAGLDALWDEILAFESAADLETPSLRAMIAHHRLVAGDVLGARAILSELAADRFAVVHDDSEWLGTMQTVATVAVGVGDRDRAALIYDLLLPYQDLWVVDGIGAYVPGSVHGVLASLAEALGRDADAARHRDAARSDVLRPVVVAGREGNRFARHGELWGIRFAGSDVLVRDAKGIRDLAALVARPGHDIAAVDLMGVRLAEGGGEVLDARAREAYRARLVDLQDDLEEAEAHADGERAARVQGEIDALVTELTRAVGLGGRGRRAPDAAERARKAVSTRIGLSIGRIEELHPALGRHLRHSIRTGAFCSYRPEQPVAWETE